MKASGPHVEAVYHLQVCVGQRHCITTMFFPFVLNWFSLYLVRSQLPKGNTFCILGSTPYVFQLVGSFAILSVVRGDPDSSYPLRYSQWGGGSTICDLVTWNHLCFCWGNPLYYALVKGWDPLRAMQEDNLCYIQWENSLHSLRAQFKEEHYAVV